MSSISNITETLYITNNPYLINLIGLSNLTRIGEFATNGGLLIENNSTLTNLNGLENLTSVEYLTINDNESLTDFCGLQNLDLIDFDVNFTGNAYNPTKEDLESGNCSL